jgi:hypothetical protein
MKDPIPVLAVILLSFLGGLACAGTRHVSGVVSGLLFLSAAVLYGLFCMP